MIVYHIPVIALNLLIFLAVLLVAFLLVLILYIAFIIRWPHHGMEMFY